MRRLRWSTLLMLGVALVPAIAGVLLVQLQRGRFETLGSVIDVSARQRTLVERVELLAHSLLHESDAGRHEQQRDRLLATAAELERSHEALLNRDGGLGLTGTLSAEARSLYLGPEASVDADLRKFAGQVREFARAPMEMLRPDTISHAALKQDAEGLKPGLDAVVRQYNAEHDAAARGFQQLSIAVGAATAAVLLVAWFAVFRRTLARVETERGSALEKERRFRAIVENAYDVVAEWDADGHVLFVSPGIKEVTGLPAEHFPGTYWYEHSGEVPAGALETVRAALHEAVTELRRKTVTLREKLPTGEDGSWVELALQPFHTDKGELRIVVVRRDLSETREVEELRLVTKELRATAANLERANQELESFASIASHDLQEPLRNIVSFGKLLREDAGDALPEAARRDVAFITDAASRMTTLIKDLLALARMGAAPVRREYVDLDALVDGVLLDLERAVLDAGARIERDALPRLRGDETLIRELYLNLIGNALKFRRGPNPEIHLSAERRGGLWVLGVRDDGIGVDPGLREEIFQPFRRLHARGDYAGTGIGLAICRKAVERHGGRIWLASAASGGSHFRFTLQPEDDARGSS